MPMFADPRNRTCIEEETYAEQKVRLGVTVQRLDAILEGLLAKVSRFPERSYLIPETDLMSEISMGFPEAPSVWLLFTFDADCVYLRWIELY